ncbi:MAG: ATP synthase F1 subunit delta [Clostridia bacterium]|nr:ATP synthase F1 subunit delta [Clostridia bacterium]
MIQTEREYAEALFMIAAEDNQAAEYVSALELVKQVIGENAEYIEFLASPVIPLNERIEAIDGAFEGNIPENVVSFLKVLCENGRFGTIFGCIDEFIKLSMALSDRTAARIYSAVPLNDEQKKNICEKLGKLTKKTVEAEYIIDKSLIGGIKIEVDGKTFDGSIKHRLEEVKDVITG